MLFKIGVVGYRNHAKRIIDIVNKSNYVKAEKHYSRALSLVPDSPTILKSLVNLKSYQGEYADAIQYLEQIMVHLPEPSLLTRLLTEAVLVS